MAVSTLAAGPFLDLDLARARLGRGAAVAEVAETQPSAPQTHHHRDDRDFGSLAS